jgi:branched-chain amino acid transport system ATP-binding protein
MLQIKNLHAGYGDNLVLRGVNIQANAGEIVALIGPNGAGKSTNLRAIFSQCDITSGKIMFKGKNIKHVPAHKVIKQGISLVNQGKNVFENLTVKENLLIGSDHVKDKKIIKKSFEEVYNLFPILKEKCSKRVSTLSGGQRQMLAIGKSLMANPQVLILDEPSLGLSPKAQKEIFWAIKKLKEEGISVLIVEQNAKQALLLADKTYLLENGEVVLSGGKELLENPIIKNVYLG